MKKFAFLLPLVSALLGRIVSAAEPTPTPTSSPSFVLCAGNAEAFLLDLAAAERGEVHKLWSWTAADCAELPEDRRRWFKNMDECKPIDGGRRILVCASNTGCALLDRATKKLLWHTSATNAHSLEMLPGNRIAVASSLSGDHLLLYDLAATVPEKPIWKTPLHSAHGLVWDEGRRCLWALGQAELRRYELKDWDGAEPALSLVATHELPDVDGHDLRPVPASNDLVLTTGKTVQLFDRESGRFRPHPAAGELVAVKAFDVDPTSGRVIYTHWGPTLKLLGPTGTVELKGHRVYKVRWFPYAVADAVEAR